MKLVKSPRFVRDAKRLIRRRPEVAEDIRLALDLLAIDQFNPQLGTHKLKGQRPDTWSVSVAYKLRILFHFIIEEGEKKILLITIGSHDDVY